MSVKRFGKFFGKFMCAAALLGVAVSIPLTAAGCSTDHPEAKITVEYKGTEYVLNYKMYRNMYPQTVQHFIELADAGFYNNTIVHDQNTVDGKYYCGGYNLYSSEEQTYEEAKNAFTATYSMDTEDRIDYFEEHSKEYEYYQLADPANGKITPSVYLHHENNEYSDPLRTLIGEFSKNQHKIDNGELKRSFGCLSMYYYTKDSDKVNEVLGGEPFVYLKKKGSASGVRGEYKYNSATSIFGIQTGSSTSTSTEYCVFGTLKNTTRLTDLTKAVGSTYKSLTLYVDSYDEIVGKNSTSQTFRVPQTAVVIKSVKITKY